MKDYESLKKDIMKRLRGRQMRESVGRAKESVKSVSHSHIRYAPGEDREQYELVDEKLAAADYETREEQYSSACATLNSAFSDISIGGISEDEEIKYLQAIDKRAVRLIEKMAKDRKYPLPLYKSTVEQVLSLKKDLDDEIEKRKVGKHGGLEKAVSAIIGFGGILAGILFLSPQITGNAIGNIGEPLTNNLAMVSFFVGVAGLFVFLRARKRR